ncbi:2-nitropropane dioxygenase [Capnocytophaga catalasegens]|uniref:2-nitropropane dioxygenase n=2 Tax=Capnocytophaga catalasegens TaxID=1004260 RepID=A0AAV5AZD0_9FLAO|nr:2-nitropropane dioxygenase [Capnocytophaga catalasegens]GJM50957.1 2-nitropropane dioxygenase [Capnocytophaga catalasegens]GJM52141.1 2-nitropropane dioxygenase [Capnocytophaga catalasegens]
MKNRITQLFDIQYPIIQGGMIWASGWRLVSAVSNSGGLGLLGSGSMSSEILREHIRKCKLHTNKPFGVNVPIMYENSANTIQVILEEKVPIVFTSAGNPKTWTSTLQKEGIKVAHVVSSAKFALKAQEAGVDAIVAEGFEAGGHNGREETTTLALIPSVREQINIPLIAAGGIATGQAIFAVMALGAEGVQIGSRFVATHQCEMHENFKREVVRAKEGDTILTLKELSPVRMLKNKFFDQITNLYQLGKATPESLKELIGKGRTKKGMFEGDLDEGILEIGQVASIINDIKSVEEVFQELLIDFKKIQKQMSQFQID